MFRWCQAKLPLLVSIIMGLQHSLAMLGGIITPPSLIAGHPKKNRALQLADVKLCFFSRFHGLLLTLQAIEGMPMLKHDPEKKTNIYWQLFKKY